MAFCSDDDEAAAASRGAAVAALRKFLYINPDFAPKIATFARGMADDSLFDNAVKFGFRSGIPTEGITAGLLACVDQLVGTAVDWESWYDIPLPIDSLSASYFEQDLMTNL